MQVLNLNPVVSIFIDLGHPVLGLSECWAGEDLLSLWTRHLAVPFMHTKNQSINLGKETPNHCMWSTFSKIPHFRKLEYICYSPSNALL